VCPTVQGTKLCEGTLCRSATGKLADFRTHDRGFVCQLVRPCLKYLADKASTVCRVVRCVGVGDAKSVSQECRFLSKYGSSMPLVNAPHTRIDQVCLEDFQKCPGSRQTHAQGNTNALCRHWCALCPAPVLV